MKPHQKSLVGAVIALAAAGAGIIACAENPGLLRRPVVADRSDLALCSNPQHHDGDAIRCGGAGRSMRLYAIDAPEMPGSCRPGRQCTPGNAFAARDHLRALTAGKTVVCRQVDLDRYRRKVVHCFADDVDLSCQMVRDGYAVERYGRLNCGGGGEQSAGSFRRR